MPKSPATTALYTASEVESRTGVPATTLRQWERRYGFPSPSRTAGGYRMYSPYDLACIAYLQARQEEGVPVSRAVELARAHFSAPAAPERPVVAALVTALLRPDHREAARLLAEAHATLSTEEVMLGVMHPALGEIGRRWERGEITVAHEHQAAAFLRTRLGQLFEVAGENDLGPTVVAAGGPGEYHEIGLLMLSVVLRRRGVRVHYLGSNTPLADVAVYARAAGARGVLISLNTAASLALFRAERNDLTGSGLPLYLGGQVFAGGASLARDLGGVFLGHSATEAADRLVARLAAQPGQLDRAAEPPSQEHGSSQASGSSRDHDSSWDHGSR